MRTAPTSTFRYKLISVPVSLTRRRTKNVGEYLAGQLEKFGAKVYNQYADLIAYDGTILKSRNIIGAYKPESKKRILLCAHWDSRPYADNDPDPKNHHTPILGVNDGASGVGGGCWKSPVQIQKEQPALGIDIVFFRFGGLWNSRIL